MTIPLNGRPRWHGASRRLLVVGVLVGHACSPPGSDDDWDLDADRLPPMVLEEVLRIGSSTSPDTGFTRVASALWNENGSVYVVEATERQIRIYGATGHMHSSMGSRGAGPGEFRSIPTVQALGDTVWAFDRIQERITLFAASGRLLETHAFEPSLIQVPSEAVFSGLGDVRAATRVHAAIVPHYSIVGGLLSSELIETGWGREGGRLETGSVRVPRLTFHPSGAVHDTIGWYVRPPTSDVAVTTLSSGGRRYVVPPPPLDIPLSRSTPSGAVTVERPAPSRRVPARFRVTSVTAQHDTLYSLAFRYDPVGYPDAILDTLALSAAWAPGAVPMQPATKVGFWEIRWQLAPEGNQQTVAEAGVVRRKIRARMKYPQFQPPIQDLSTGADGSVWLRREETGSATYRWIYLDRQGRAHGVAEFPRSGFDILFSDHDRLLARVTGDDGIPWIVGYAFGPSSADMDVEVQPSSRDSDT
jgi:hypothetical protein